MERLVTLTIASTAVQDDRKPTPNEAFPWLGLRSRFLESHSQVDQLRIFDLTARVSHSLRLWAVRYPLVRRVRVWPLALSVAAAAPFSSVDALISTARVSLWVFTIDDIFDEERVPESEMVKRADRYRALAHGKSVDIAEDSLATALQEIRQDLTRYPLFASLGDEWANSLCGTIDGMMREYQWRAMMRQDPAAPMPSYEEYIANGLYSIGGPPHIWAELITINDASTPDHIERLRPMERIASTCIRLANDLQSYRKEVAEGNINALVLLGRALEAAGFSATEAHQQAECRVRDDILDGLATLDVLRSSASTRTRRPEGAIADIARFVCDFYQEHDYHTFLTQAGMTNGSR
jgi:Terpene synthase family 2, C-terminal metal binding